ncbi:hypothetical protein [Litorisediminicola beolgyonensis]|uniref:DUF4258 domain-containing protein n=1 Tax=Litorisediminicola beolgyonensis TaxID=1173614 RepID=A0ABW3ZIG2_9RHOB
MKKPLLHVTDHAVVRYLERVAGLDIAAIRCEIGRRAEQAIEHGAAGAISGGFVHRIVDGSVVTVTPHNQPKIGQGKRRGSAQDD